jgi:hypothetical protein
LGTVGGDNLGRLLTNIIDVSDDGVNHLSHRIVRYMVNRNNIKSNFYGYGRSLFISACDPVVRMINKKINNFYKQTIMNHLVKINIGIKSLEAFIPNYLEKLAVLYLISPDGLQWKYQSLIEVESHIAPIL